ncbi:hypothetical protein NX059_009802 [Plenodomus lindquistii]|nr:hypothetical protein NX059_009802 [Plenodomus lindquistii]
MSALTPPSFIDDGISFTKRTPHGLAPSQITSWLENTSSDSTSTSTSTSASASAYTGSYIDDGADMLPGTREEPGFGPIDTRFYKQRKRTQQHDGLWNDAVQVAVSGDIARNLARVRGLVGVGRRDRGGGERREREKEMVVVPVPRQWGSFVITGEDGRVIVVDGEGEFDSGVRGQGREEKRREGPRWVRAPERRGEMGVRDDGVPRRERKEKRHRRSHRCKKGHCACVPAPPLKPLTTIAESEHEEMDQVSDGEDPVSPTGFFMTGGASGWPSREATSVASPARSEAHVRSSPGAWPSPPLSPIRSTAPSKHSSDQSSSWLGELEDRSARSLSSHHSNKSPKTRRSRRHEIDNMSTKSYSTYKAPTVEDALSTSSQSARSSKHVGWVDSAQDDDTWGERKEASKKGSDVSWNGSKKSSVSGWSSSRKAASENSWDGFEKNKTASEISVAGSGSERSTLSSRAPSQALSDLSGKVSTHGSHRSHRSEKSGTSLPGWDGSQVSKKRWSSEKAHVDDDGWGGETSQSGWDGSEMSGKRYGAGSNGSANGFDEADETYLNENWGGRRVRVGSRQTSVAGWS